MSARLRIGMQCLLNPSSAIITYVREFRGPDRVGLYHERFAIGIKLVSHSSSSRQNDTLKANF
jgi:hypothetical protein